MIKKITKYGMEIEYKDGSTDSYPLGLTIGKASGENHRHTRVTDLKEGDKFKAGEIIGWDEQFFERDLMNPRQVSWKCGVLATIALVENQFTYEDSIEISSKFAAETMTHYIKDKSFTVDEKQSIIPMANVGDEVDYDDVLCYIEDESVSLLGDDSGEFSGLNKLGVKQIKSPLQGKVVRITCVYNADLADMSEKLREFVSKTDKTLSSEGKFEGNGVKDGNVRGSSLRNSKLYPGTVSITYYIENIIDCTSADKFVIGNQMKGTVGNIYSEPKTTESGIPIDVVFSFKSLFNRMVLSLRDKLVVNTLGKGLTNHFIKIYRGDKK